ncbi:nucleoside hydrolase [Pseudomarimonas salicorniae]|uniref:Nucleoside hydrolase n=1 Tax=Pseudomarimonas salicorniae TaxID=2933270 RepID=A0ABT0GJ28_9GAMM|nr:nucleoside hydrolase [Lysobacter sp. CAU 1642]MCK7594548.1 nucleoside hydrolase [Lysobacter sp. CAU 1642]
MPPIPLLIDTDPGVDDALAILMALNSPLHRVTGLCIAAGNVGLAHTTRNALKLLEVAGVRQVPVYAGCDRPLLHPALDAAFVHGHDGFGDIGYADPAGRAEPLHAALAILEQSHRHAGELLLVTLGPLTNLALALRLDPSLPQRVARLVVMGGAVTGRGNITPSAEFNIAFDPEAAHVVFEAWPRFDLVDWEATLAHPFAFEDATRWMRDGGELGAFYEAISRTSRAFTAARSEHWHSADGLAMAVALAPDALLEWADRRIEVELQGPLYRGATRVDWAQHGERAANARIVQRFDPQRYLGMLSAALRR